MRPQLIRLYFGLVALALSAGASPAMALDALPAPTADAMAQAASPQAIAEYRRKLKEYEAVHGLFEAEAGAHWAWISEKRKGRNASGAIASRLRSTITC